MHAGIAPQSTTRALLSGALRPPLSDCAIPRHRLLIRKAAQSARGTGTPEVALCGSQGVGLPQRTMPRVRGGTGTGNCNVTAAVLPRTCARAHSWLIAVPTGAHASSRHVLPTNPKRPELAQGELAGFTPTTLAGACTGWEAGAAGRNKSRGEDPQWEAQSYAHMCPFKSFKTAAGPLPF